MLGSSAVNLQLVSDSLGSSANWVIRAAGTTAAGRPIHLGGGEAVTE